MDSQECEKQVSDISSSTSSIINARGLKLFTKSWEPVRKTRALVFIAHGYGEHCLLYDNLAKHLASNSFYVFSHDHVGHGQSEGQRAFVDSFDVFIDDIFRHVDLVRKNNPGFDCFICGHSMGGAISILSAIRKPHYFKGVILIGPFVRMNPELATPFKVTMAKVLRWIAPQFPVGSMDLSLVSSCPKQVEEMKKDPLRFHGYFKAGLGVCFMEASKEIKENISSITFPFLLCQGEDDKLCIPEGAIFLYENSSSTDKCLKMYPKAYHNLLYEPNGVAEQVISDILEWITARA